MKRGNGKANRQKRTIWILAAVLGMTPFSAALQTSVPVSVPVPALPKAPELAKATVRWVLVSIPDRKLALIANGKVVHVYRVAVGKTSTPSPVGEFTIVSRVSNPAYYHKGQGYRRGQAEPGGHALDGTEREGLRNPRHQPAKLDRQSGIDGMHSHVKQDVEELFAMVGVGDTVEIRAERDEQIAAVFGSGAGAGTETETVAQLETGSSSGGGQ